MTAILLKIKQRW